jgi:hypothetical protein
MTTGNFFIVMAHTIVSQRSFTFFSLYLTNLFKFSILIDMTSTDLPTASPKPNQHTNNTNIINQTAQSLGLSTGAIYVAIGLVVLSATFVITSASLLTISDTDQRTQASQYKTVGCNEPCTSNRYCQTNYFCYQGYCRLASNPTDVTCETQVNDASQDPQQKGYDPRQDDAETEDQPEAGAVNEPDDTLENLENSTAEAQLSSDDRETVFALLLRKVNEIKMDQNLLISIAAGVGMMVLIIIIAISTLFVKKSATPQPLKPKVKTLVEQTETKSSQKKQLKVEQNPIIGQSSPTDSNPTPPNSTRIK